MKNDLDYMLLRPKPSSVNSRDDTDVSTVLGKWLKLDIPIVASPMKGIVGVDLIQGLDLVGGIGILHRFHPTMQDFMLDINKLSEYLFGFAIGLHDDSGKLDYGISHGAAIVCLDIANGYTDTVLKKVSYIADYISKQKYRCLLMAGNVVDSVGANRLKDAGADLVRVGIGTGHLCTTRQVTGVGVRHIDAIRDCAYNSDAIIIADGGIRTSGDCVKALVLGADAIMMGTLFAQTMESTHNGIIYGSASRKLQEEYYHGVKSVEGIEELHVKTKPLQTFIDEFVYGIRSAMTYLNARTLLDLRNADWVLYEYN